MRIKNSLRSEDNYLWDVFPITEIGDGRLFINSPSHRNQLISLFRQRQGLKPEQRHRGVGWRFLDIEDDEIREGRQIFIPDLDIVGQDGFPLNSFWTGSILKYEHNYYAFITDSKYDEPTAGFNQKIVLKKSSDLTQWEDVEEVELLADGTIYDDRIDIDSTDKTGAFRDPFIFPRENGFGMVFAGRDNSKPRPYNGCVGYAESADLVNWQLKEPLLSPGIASEMEVPQIIMKSTAETFLLISCHAVVLKPKYKNHAPQLVYKKTKGGEFNLYGCGYIKGIPKDIYVVRCLDIDEQRGEITAIAFHNEGEKEASLTQSFRIALKDSFEFIG